MFSHLLKLMWNKRRANSMIFLEILLAFVVLFGVFAFTFYNVDRYSSPLGFEYENQLGIALDFEDEMDSLKVIELQERIRRDLLDMADIDGATFVGPVNPFGGRNWSWGSDDNGIDIYTAMMFVDEHFRETMNVRMTDGRWFTAEDYRGKYPPAVVNQKFKDEFYPDVESIVDSVLTLSGEHRIVGVTEDFKYRSNFAENTPVTFFSQLKRNAGEDPFEQMILTVRPGQKAAVEESVYNYLVDQTKNTDVVIWDMADDRVKANRTVVIPMVILFVISGFLLINIALGLFGVLFTQINRRRAEIGVRKAMGATASEVTWQFIFEVSLVTLAGLLLGAVFAVQVPLLELLPIPGKYFYQSIGAAIAVILGIVVLCAVIPSRMASRLHPAHVLHEE